VPRWVVRGDVLGRWVSFGDGRRGEEDGRTREREEDEREGEKRTVG
jgi:hypothetical protein